MKNKKNIILGLSLSFVDYILAFYFAFQNEKIYSCFFFLIGFMILGLLSNYLSFKEINDKLDRIEETIKEGND